MAVDRSMVTKIEREDNVLCLTSGQSKHGWNLHNGDDLDGNRGNGALVS